MLEYRIWKFCPLVFAVAYPLLSGTTLIVRRHECIQEIYPFAPWTLFCFVPNQQSEFDARLLAIDGRSLDPPQFVDELVELSEHQRLLAYSAVQELGQLIETNNRETLAARRRRYERTFLKLAGKDVKYEVIRREFDVLDRWKSGTCNTVESIGMFESNFNGAAK